MGVQQFHWSKLSREQAEVLRYLAEAGKYSKRPLGPRLAEDALGDASRSGVAVTLLGNLQVAGLLSNAKKSGRLWVSVELDAVAAEYARANPYLGLSAREAVLKYLKDEGPAMGEGVRAAASPIISEGTGYHHTTISSTLHHLEEDGSIEVTESSGGGRYIIGCRLPGDERPPHSKARVCLTPDVWEEERRIKSSAKPEGTLTATAEVTTPEAEPEDEPIEYAPVEVEEDAYSVLAQHLLAQVIEKLTAEPVAKESDGRELSRLQSELDHAKEWNTQLRQDLDATQLELTQLRTNYNTIKGRYEAVSDELDNLRRRLRESRQSQEDRIKRYPLDEDKKKALQALMKELPRG